MKNKKRFSRYDKKEAGLAVLFVAPFFILFFIFTVIPVISAVFYSFTNYSVVQSSIWVGLRNYRFLFTEDNLFITALSNTLIFALLTGAIGFFASFFVAWIIDTLRFKKFFALAFYAPSITSGIAMSVIWLYFFSADENGFINHVLMNIGIIDSPVLWNQDPSKVVYIIVIVTVWMSMGNGFLGFLAGFQNLSVEIQEAGRIDGISNKFQELIYIVGPQMKPMLLFGAVNSIVSAFNIYEVPLTLVGNPGPENSALTLVGHLNDYAFTRMDMGYASAVAVVIFLLTFICGRIAFRVFGTKD